MKEKRVKIASHFDTDGLSSAAIVAKLAAHMGINFQLSVHKQLTDDVIEEIAYNNGGYIALKTDLQITTAFPKYLKKLVPTEIETLKLHKELEAF